MSERSMIGRYAQLKDAQIKAEREECALDMGQSPNDAVVKDVKVKPGREEYV